MLPPDFWTFSDRNPYHPSDFFRNGLHLADFALMTNRSCLQVMVSVCPRGEPCLTGCEHVSITFEARVLWCEKLLFHGGKTTTAAYA